MKVKIEVKQQTVLLFSIFGQLRTYSPSLLSCLVALLTCLGEHFAKSSTAGLNTWLNGREDYLAKAPVGTSLNEVEDLLSRHEDFERTVLAQEDRFDAIKRLTLLEKSFKEQKEDEKALQDGILNKDRIAEIKRRETQRLAEQR